MLYLVLVVCKPQGQSAINNPNGLNVTGAVSIGGTENRLSIKSPPTTGFTTANPFPFEIGDEVFVENVPN